MEPIQMAALSDNWVFGYFIANIATVGCIAHFISLIKYFIKIISYVLEIQSIQTEKPTRSRTQQGIG